MRLRSLVRPFVAVVAGLALVGTGAAAASAQPAHNTRSFFPASIPLPNGFQPEGIAIGRAPVAYFGSRVDGDIYAASLITGKGKVISQGPGTPSMGMKVDEQGRLFVAGGVGGDGRIVDVRTGAVLAEYHFTTRTSFVNDVVLSGGYAWFTDSMQAQLYGVPIRSHGVAPASSVITRPLTGQWVQTPGVLNANGIAGTPDGRALLVVQSNTGLLFRVDPRTGVATRVDLGGYVLTNGDGLLLRGHVLYAVQNMLNKVAALDLNRSGTAGRLVRTLTSPAFDVPSTVAAFGPFLYLVNARFTTPATPTTTYSANRILGLLHG